ncbi:Protein of unknown function [Bacillus cereus]|nr:Protein of unknown function [Bacillus cereus]
MDYYGQQQTIGAYIVEEVSG